MSGVNVNHALKTKPLAPAVFIKKLKAEIIKRIPHCVYFSRFKYIRLPLPLFYFISMKEHANSARTVFSDIVTTSCLVPTVGDLDLKNKFVYNISSLPSCISNVHKSHSLQPSH